jgi:chromosome segregation ATPase
VFKSKVEILKFNLYLNPSLLTIKSLLESGKHNTFVQPIIDVLMELGKSSHVDLAQVQQIIELINTLLKRLRDGLRERYAQNQHTVEGLNNLIADLKTQIKDHSLQLTIYEDRIKAITERTEQLKKVVAQTETILDATQALLDGTKADCVSDAEAYTSAELAR